MPIIGIITTNLTREGIIQPRGVQSELAYMSLLSQNMPAHVVVFTPEDINWNQKTVRGYRYVEEEDGTGHWVGRWIPLPDVIYDQIHTRTAEKRHSATRNRLKEHTAGKYFNPSLLNKLKVHLLLMEDPEIIQFLPQTKPLKDAEDIEAYLNKYENIYLKPVAGSLGRGIIRVKKDEDRYKYQTRGGHVGSASNVHDLFRKVKKWMKDHKYLIQQGLDLFRFDDRVVDIRVMMQKNGKGKWSLTKIYARVGSKFNITSNLASGGTAHPIDEVLSTKFDEMKISEIKGAMREMAFAVCRALEQATGELFGELGIDIGLDNDDKLWLIEINSKPRKATEGSGDNRLIDLSFMKPLSYARFLAETTSTENKQEPEGAACEKNNKQSHTTPKTRTKL
ncbi:MAG: YheC/YheD family protein [Acidobacteriota bacterium]